MTDQIQQFEARLVDAETELERATEEAREVGRRLERARTEVDGLRQVIAGLRTLNRIDVPQKEQLPVDDAATVTLTLTPSGREGETPRGREAVRLIMQERPGPWKQADLVAEVKRRGWIDPEAKNPDAAIRVAVRRLHEDRELERIGTGVYRIKDSSGTPLEAAARLAVGLGATIEEGGQA